MTARTRVTELVITDLDVQAISTGILCRNALIDRCTVESGNTGVNIVRSTIRNSNIRLEGITGGSSTGIRVFEGTAEGCFVDALEMEAGFGLNGFVGIMSLFRGCRSL